MSNHRRTHVFGWIILIIGALLMFNHWHHIHFDWTAVLMIIGVVFLVAGLLRRDHGAVFPGTFLFLLGLLFYLKENHILWMPWWEMQVREAFRPG